MDEKVRYYKFIAGSVIVRRQGDKIEKNGKNGVWEDAQNLLWRFVSDDDSLIEISEEEANHIISMKAINCMKSMDTRS